MKLGIDMNVDQANILWRYITDEHVIINSARRSGKSRTLAIVFRYWLTHQMKDGETCIIIGRSFSSIRYFKDLIKEQLTDVKFTETSQEFTIKTPDNRTCYVSLCSTIDEYYRRKNDHRYLGTKTSLIIGDECYISASMCDRTACAFTQQRSFNKLRIPSDMTDDILQAKVRMSREQFYIEFGQYLPNNDFN